MTQLVYLINIYFGRPIISANGTFNHATAKYLAQLLAPLAYNEYIVKDAV